MVVGAAWTKKCQGRFFVPVQPWHQVITQLSPVTLQVLIWIQDLKFRPQSPNKQPQLQKQAQYLFIIFNIIYYQLFSTNKWATYL